ncbi:hypothetical protein B0H14DRAFT_2588041 [Mycena olivaceomarginata]|nr:hypothetical protein B0H14DRAFT_2588041 [Mycena olivaceomarginata]
MTHTDVAAGTFYAPTPPSPPATSSAYRGREGRAVDVEPTVLDSTPSHYLSVRRSLCFRHCVIRCDFGPIFPARMWRRVLADVTSEDEETAPLYRSDSAAFDDPTAPLIDFHPSPSRITKSAFLPVKLQLHMPASFVDVPALPTSARDSSPSPQAPSTPDSSPSAMTLGPPTEDGLVPPDEGAALVRQFLFPFLEVSANTAQNHRPRLCGCRSFDSAEESSSTAAQTGAEEEVENVWFWSVWSNADAFNSCSNNELCPSFEYWARTGGVSGEAASAWLRLDPTLIFILPRKELCVRPGTGLTNHAARLFQIIPCSS